MDNPWTHEKIAENINRANPWSPKKVVISDISSQVVSDIKRVDPFIEELLADIGSYTNQ